MTLRRLFFWLHLAVGLVAGLLIAFLALTGAIISFQPQLITFAERGIHAQHPAATPCVLPSTLLAHAAAITARPLTSLTLFADPARPTQIATTQDGAVLLADACTGQILGPGANRLRVLLTAVRELHHQATFQGVRYETLRTLKNAAALTFVFLTLSGLVLWFPRKLTWQHLRPSLLFRPNLHGRAREWNLHNLAGFWLCLPLFVIAVTGTIMAYPWANNLLYRAAGETPPPPRREATQPAQRNAAQPHHRDSTESDHRDTAQPSRREATQPGHRIAAQLPLSAEAPPIAHPHQSEPALADFTALDAPIARALSFEPTTVSATLRLPSATALVSAPSLTFQLAIDDRGQSMSRDQLTLRIADAAVLKFEPFAHASRARHWRITARYLHTGELFGVPGQAIALHAALGALLLVWTGFALALRRLAAFRRRRNQPQPSSATAPETRKPLQVSH